MQARVGLLVMDVMPIFMIIALDIVITLHFSINCSIVICLPTVCFLSREKPLVKTMAPGSTFIIYKNIKIACCNFISFIFLYLSLSDLILASDCEGIDNPFIVLGASV